LRSSGESVAKIVERLEAGSALRDLVDLPRLEPVDLIAALAWTALGDDGSLGPGLVQAKPSRPRLAQSLSEPTLSNVFPRASETSRLALEAGLLQAHDFWDASHGAAQRADDMGERDFSAYWHGIAHRREPDPANASYWFRRVGRHRVFSSLAAAARRLLDAHNESALGKTLLAGGQWNAFTMIDLCTQARPGSAIETLARRLQRLEMWLLLEATVVPLDAV
jgi:hypothetical protein